MPSSAPNSSWWRAIPAATSCRSPWRRARRRAIAAGPGPPCASAISFTSWRGVVGLVKPPMRPGNLEELIKLMPDGVAVLPLYNNIRRGTVDELKAALAGFEAKVAELAECGVDVIHPSGAPPFMV